jgi:hypothetical protein
MSTNIIVDWRELPRELVYKIMSYWRPRVQLTYLRQIEIAHVYVLSGCVDNERRDASALFLNLYINSTRAHQYFTDFMHKHSPEIADQFESEAKIPVIWNGIEYARQLMHNTTIFWNKMNMNRKFIELLNDLCIYAKRLKRLREGIGRTDLCDFIFIQRMWRML